MAEGFCEETSAHVNYIYIRHTKRNKKVRKSKRT